MQDIKCQFIYSDYTIVIYLVVFVEKFSLLSELKKAIIQSHL